MDYGTSERPVARRSTEVQRERVEALLEEQRRREERADSRRTRFRRVLEGPETRAENHWTPLEP